MPAEGGGPRRARRRALAALAGAASGLVPGPDAARAADRPPPGVPGTPAPSAPPARGDTHPFAFGLIGDLPYTETGEPDAAALIDALGAEPLALVIHVGDLKGGRESCSDALLARRHAILARSAHPLVLLPGDNEWTDCHRLLAGGFDPLERLAALRARFWSDPSPLGARGDAARTAYAFERQRGQPENVRWRIGPVRFAGLHVVGSGNGRDGFEGARASFAERRDRNRAWLRETVRTALAERADALVIAAHADPDFERATPRAGFTDWIADLRDAADAFPRPILVLHGDSHRFRADRPLADRTGRRYAHVTRVECFGWPFTASWVRIDYDPRDPARFRVATRELAPARPRA